MSQTGLDGVEVPGRFRADPFNLHEPFGVLLKDIEDGLVLLQERFSSRFCIDAGDGIGQEQFKQINVELARKWPVITEKGEPPADAKEWEGRVDKVKLLER